MRKLFYPIAAIAIMAVCSFTAFQSTDLKIADNYSVKFDGGDPSGEFKGLKGIIQFDPANPGAQLLVAHLVQLGTCDHLLGLP